MIARPEVVKIEAFRSESVPLTRYWGKYLVERSYYILEYGGNQNDSTPWK